MTLPLFQTGAHGVERAVERREAGIAKAAESAGEAWVSAAYAAFERWCVGRVTAFVDDFHRDTKGAWCRKAFGAVILRAVKRGLIEPTEEYRPSIQSNGSVKRVWAVRRQP